MIGIMPKAEAEADSFARVRRARAFVPFGTLESPPQIASGQEGPSEYARLLRRRQEIAVRCTRSEVVDRLNT
eukprot:scaffold1863_cov381-Prasinococcus_capsulatus_cf.AAC.7